MEALSYLKFWKPSVSFSSGTETPPSVYDYDFSDEDEVSLFELDLNVSVFYENTQPKIFNQIKNTSKQSTPSCQSPMSNFFSRRKILPIESQPNSRPQSPISIFKSSKKFSKLKFRKSKSLPTPEREKTRGKQSINRAGSNLSLFDDVSSSKRFTKDVVQKYLKLVTTSNLKCSDSLSSPVNSSKIPGTVSVFSAVTANGVSSPAWKDDSALRSDGIQSAILHCKKSFRS